MIRTTKLSQRASLLGIALTFVFEGMEESDSRFEALRLFENEEKINIRSKTQGSSQEYKQYNIRIFTDFDNYEEVHGLICSEIISHKVQLQQLGLEDGVNFEFFLEYEGTAHWTLKHAQLIKLFEITGGYPGLSFNSIDQAWKEDAESYEQALYHQMVFESAGTKIPLDQIVHLWIEAYSNKYDGELNWHSDGKKISSEALVLSLKENLKNHTWNEAYVDVFNFIENQQKFFEQHGIALTYGFYQHNRRDFSGGEMDKEIINRLLQLKIGLRIVMSSSAPMEVQLNT